MLTVMFWVMEISKLLALLKLERGQEKGMIVIAIGDSLSLPTNSFMLENAVENQVNSLLFVVDECHKILGRQDIRRMEINFQMTLGPVPPLKDRMTKRVQRVFSILGSTVHTYLKEDSMIAIFQNLIITSKRRI